MYDAQTLQCTGATATTVYSPWFPRGGDYGLFTVDLVGMSTTTSSSTLTVALYHKNSSDTGDGSSVGSTFSRDGTQVGTRVSGQITAGFKELVRYKFTLQVTGGSGTNWAIFRMLAPTWYDAVGA